MEQNTETSISDLFASLPGHIYTKDKNGVYLASNNRDELCCALDNKKKGSDLVVKTDNLPITACKLINELEDMDSFF